ncbi:hypothetical protein [Hydrogenophaga sp. PAMC20947]|uniref:hypothetical protein n=1 Tax=Hydrogenophaga sp. PAMC20947 TaxID=2565558 RepID=UPI00109D91FA|nr:hypothetical protein [Hydrogenophaga sp. PAMC20947]QCB48333.1 hypothetical protein E5678_21280 [Hydrogenophaga sp. PAMC20947]
MSVAELVVWAGMAGAVGVLCLVALGDWLVQRTADTARGLAFISMMGGASVLMSGLPEQVWPLLDPLALLSLKATLGPMSGALALGYLGAWLEAGRSETWIRRALWLGSFLLVLGSVGLAMAAVLTGGRHAFQVLAVSGAMTLLMVVLALVVSVRGAMLGDRLARWMVVACACLGASVVGLYAKGLGVSGPGVFLWFCTALFSVAYFLIVIALTIQRNREVRRLRHLAAGLSAQDYAIPMPQGSLLIPRVAEAMWRSHRLERPCVVAALVVRNLYELGDQVEQGFEAQILAVLAARVRRHVGFRNVVGLYHPRCFILAVSSSQDPRRGELLVEALLQSVCERVRVGSTDQHFNFWPNVAVGVVDVTHSPVDALAAIDRAEQLALESPAWKDPDGRWEDAETRPSAL